MAERIPQSATIRVPLQAYLAGTATPATGKTIAVTVSKNGGAYGNPSGGATNATEIASGSYYADLSTTDTGTIGPLFVKGAEGTIDNVIAIYSVTGPVVATLVSTGLDAITATAPSGPATTFPQMLVQTWRRYFKKTVKASSGATIKTYADDGSTVVTTQTYADDGAGNESVTAAT